MEKRNLHANSDYNPKLLREKAKRETKIPKLQNEQQQLRPLCPKKPKKLSEKWLKQDTAVNNEKSETARKSDLLSEIDNELNGDAKGFVYRKGN